MKTSCQTSIDTARAALTPARNAVQSEIFAPATPISGCDAQVNLALADRRNVLEAQRRLDRTDFVPTPRTATEHGGVKSR